MKKSAFLKFGGFGLLTLILGIGAYLYFIKDSSSKIVLADEAKENSIKLHNAMGEHACDCFQPWIANVTISNITSTSVDVTWDCGTYLNGAGPATYQVTYGTTTAKDKIYPATQPTVTYTKSTVTVPNLTPNTTYHIGVKSLCLSNCSRGGGPDMPKTFQQSPHVEDWTVKTLAQGTTYSVSGTIKDGATAIAGVIVSLSGGAAKKDTTDASGAYSFTGLTTGTYTVTPSKSGYTFDPANKTVTISTSNLTQNYAATVTTAVKQVAQTAAIMDVAATEITAKDVTVKWKTSIPATSMVEYGLNQNYGMNSGINTEMSYNHTIQLFQLQKGATYHARVVSFTSDDPKSASYSPDFTFKTPAIEDRIAEKKFIINEPNPVSSWTMFSCFLYQPAKSVKIDVLTLSGKLVAHLESPSSSLAEGWNKVRWDNINLKNGLYIYKMTFKTQNNIEETIQCSNLRVQK
jgi:Fibronectin type III domain/SdrD B-like domain